MQGASGAGIYSRQSGLFENLTRQVLFDFAVARDGDSQISASENVMRPLRAHSDEACGGQLFDQRASFHEGTKAKSFSRTAPGGGAAAFVPN